VWPAPFVSYPIFALAPGTFTTIQNDLQLLILSSDLQVDIQQSILDETLVANTIANDSNAKLGEILDVLQQTLSLLNVALTVSTGPNISIQDMLRNVIEDLEPPSGVAYLSVLPTWNDDSKCKVTVSGTVAIEGTVSVEPGFAPLDVIVVA
jgi:hypothetical protein